MRGAECFLPEQMRRIVSAIAKRTFARGKTNREKSGKRPLKSPLYQAALATERALWTSQARSAPRVILVPLSHTQKS